MNPKFYKYCAVPLCKNTTIKTPDKLFIHVPSNKAIRKKWLELAQTDLAVMNTKSNNKYFCEDHFDLPKDMENYMEYHVMGAVSIIRMRPGCLPTKFEFGHQTPTSDATRQPDLNKKRSKEREELERNEKVDPQQCNNLVDDPSATPALKMDRKWYASCMVPQCRNTTIKAPGKIFIKVPLMPKIRLKWLQLARRDTAQLSPKAALYCCEDHFDLPNDMQNYMKYKVMGSVKTIRMVPGCLPSRFDCQPDRRKRFSYKTTRSLALKRQRAELIREAESSVPKLEKEINLNKSINIIVDTSDSSPCVQMNEPASETDSYIELHVKKEREECPSETDVCLEDAAQELVPVKDERSWFEADVKVEVELGPEVLQQQDVYYTFNTTIETENICKLEPLEDSGGTTYVEIDVDIPECQNEQLSQYPASPASELPTNKTQFSNL